MAVNNYKLPDCYIYLYHTDEYFILPQYPDSINDNLDSHFGSQNALSRTAPIFSYNYSGPRTIQVQLQLHRDMMNSVNTVGSNVKLNIDGKVVSKIQNDPKKSNYIDYIDILIKRLQAIALPRYDASNKLVDPPKVAIRFADNIFIKGVVDGGISITYRLPLLENNQYAQVAISFNVQEIQPYDALSISKLGSFRGVTSGLKAKMGLENTKEIKRTDTTKISNSRYTR